MEASAPAPWHIDHVALRIELDPTSTRVTNESRVQGEAADPLRLDGRDLELLEVAVDGRTLADGEYACDGHTLEVPLTPGEHLVRTVVTVRPGAAGGKGVCVHDGVLHTNCEPQGFRRITWSLDRPDRRATYDVTLVGDPAEYPVMLSNGDRVGDGRLDDGRHWVRFHDTIAKPSYLFAVVAGRLATAGRPHVTGSGRTIDLRVVAVPEQIDGAAFALGKMAAAMRYDEGIGGIEHDLDALTFVAVPGYPDATEYHGLMFFDPAILVTDTRGFVDDDLVLITLNCAHEYGHHVRGNRITVRSWGQLALKEGLTVLMGQNGFREHWLGGSARVLDVVDLRRLQFPEEVTIGAPVVRGEVDDPTSLYTRTTYLKGAEIFRMIRTLVGDGDWRRVFEAFVRRFDLSSAGVDDFVELACDTVPARADDIRAVARWFSLAGRPALNVSVTGSELTMRRTDSLGDDPPVALPVVIGFLSPSGAPIAVSIDGGVPATEHTLVLRERAATCHADTREPFVIAPLRGCSAPVDLSYEVPSDQLATVLEHDDDPFARFWAAEALMIRAVDAHRSADAATADTHLGVLADALGSVLTSETDPLLLSQLLGVPDEHMLGDREQEIDVDGVAEGLAYLRAGLGTALYAPLLDVFDRHVDDPAGTSAADITARWLVEPVLALLLAVGDDDALDLARAQLSAPNPTRAVRALGQLAHLDEVDLDPLLADTYARWQQAPKLVDRWIRAQSGARRSDTIDRVRALASGDLYDRADRSRVMAVWFPFATRNRSVFHQVSGAGYRLFVDEVIELMPTRADLVIRLVGDLLQYRRFDAHRRALLRGELERMAAAPGMPDFAVGIVRGLLSDEGDAGR